MTIGQAPLSIGFMFSVESWGKTWCKYVGKKNNINQPLSALLKQIPG